MSDFCDFVPDDPSCQPDPVDPVGPDGPGPDGGDMDDDMDKDMGMEMMMANITFLLVPLMVVVQKAAWTFRYSSVYDTVGETASDTNYYSMLTMASNYWMIASHFVLHLFQFLSMFAGMAELNMMVWMYVNLANMVVMMLMGLGWMYSYNMYWDIAEDSSSSNAEATDAALALTLLEKEKLVDMAFGAHYMLALYKHHKTWMLAQWMALPEETQDAWKEKHDMDKDHDMKEDDMYALFGF